jgi:hypothetical protein
MNLFQRADEAALSVCMTAFYVIEHPSLATVRFASCADSGLSVSIIHETLLGHYTNGQADLVVEVSGFLGDEASQAIEVEDTDVLIVLCKRNSRIVASQVFEVDTSLCAQGYLLVPRGGYNLLCDQEEQLRAEDLDTMRKPEIHSGVCQECDRAVSA